LGTLIFSTQAISYPVASWQPTGLDDIINFTSPNVGQVSAKLGVGNPNYRECMPSNT
jgi:hypothetical protein